jgi:hypothetical protein
VPALPTVLVVDLANVVGSRPDGWWRDRAGATSRLLDRLGALVACTVHAGGCELLIQEVLAVSEGAARAARDPQQPGLRVDAAPRDGDTRIVELAEQLSDQGAGLVVVTADRGLRDRLPHGTTAVGPGWLLDLLGDGPAVRGAGRGQATAVPKASPTR